jgi:hypothetical protein
MEGFKIPEIQREPEGGRDPRFKTPVDNIGGNLPTPRYDTSLIYNQAFGLSDKLIKFPKASEPEVQAAQEMLFSAGEVVNINEDNVTSYLGLPVAFPIKFIGSQQVYNEYNRGDIVQVSLPDMMLPYTTIGEFTRGKVDNRTRTNGGDGTVKEVYGHDDFNIRLRGLILKSHGRDENGVEYRSPMDVVRQLKRWDDLVDSVWVSGRMFEALDIYQIYIKTIDFKQIKGFPNSIQFEIIAYSDEPIQLINR